MKPARKNSIRLSVEALEDRLMPSTIAPIAAGGRAPVTAIIYQPDWFQSNLQDPGLQSLARAEYNNDHMITRTDMLALFAQAENDGVVSGAELHDLSTLVAAGGSGVLSMPDSVQILAGKVVNGDPNNAYYRYVQMAPQNHYVAAGGGASPPSPGTWQQMALGNLQAGDPAWKMQDLVNKWFLGMDLPEDPEYSGHADYWNWGYAASTTPFANGASYYDVRQGKSHDSELLAGLAGLAQQSPGWISNNFIDNGDGTYTVRLYTSISPTTGTASPTYVTVNRFLPEDAAGNFVYANQGGSLKDPNAQLWVPLYEKAYLQAFHNTTGYSIPLVNGSPDLLNIFTHLTGEFAGGGTLTDYEEPFSHAVDYRQNAADPVYSQHFVTVTSKVASALGGSVVAIDGYLIAAGQTYTVLGHNPVTGLYTLYNPMGLGNNSASDVLELTYTQLRDIFSSYEIGNYDWPVWLN